MSEKGFFVFLIATRCFDLYESALVSRVKVKKAKPEALGGYSGSRPKSRNRTLGVNLAWEILIFWLFAGRPFFVSHPRPAVTLPLLPNITPQAHVGYQSDLQNSHEKTESQKGVGRPSL